MGQLKVITFYIRSSDSELNKQLNIVEEGMSFLCEGF